MLKKLYSWFYTVTSDPQDRGEYAGGYFQGKIRKEALALCKERKGEILEIGCGSGLFAMKLARQNNDSRIWSIDNDREKLLYVENKCKEKNLSNVHLSFQDASNLSFEDGYFDTVVCINFLLMLDSLESVKRVISQMARVCRKSGRIILEFRNAQNPIFTAKYRLAKYYDATVKDNPLHCYNLTQIEAILQALHCRIVRKKYVCSFLFKSLAPIIFIEAEKQ